MTNSNLLDVSLLAFLWLMYFIIHSVLASVQIKRWIILQFPRLMRLYRLIYNVLAILLLLPILWVMASHPGPTFWRWDGLNGWLANGLALVALLGFFKSLKYYDTQEFIGRRQWAAQRLRVEDQERFQLSPFHRHVRHPWYFFSLILIWTRDMNAAMLLSAVMMTIYFIVGSWLEEKKLVLYHGEVYLRYMKRVPGLIPLPWKSLTANEAVELLKMAERSIAPK